MKRCLTYLLVALLAATAASCDHYAQDDYEEFHVVESYLVAGAELPPVRLTRTLPLEEEYSLGKAAVRDAHIEIQLLAPSGEPEEVYPYHYEGRTSYQPGTSRTVLPERRYRLVVHLQNGDTLRAETLVPGAFDTFDNGTDSLVYQSDDQLTITATPSRYPDRQTYYIFTVEAVDPHPDDLTPFYRDAAGEEADEEEILRQYAKNSSGIINEQNYDRNPDGTLTLRLPWLAVAFYGENDVITSAIDDNMYDFLRSQNVQTGGSTLPPGEIQNIRYRVEGGIGIFGSLANDTVSVYIKREP